jgi:hypothetical protein
MFKLFEAMNELELPAWIIAWYLRDFDFPSSCCARTGEGERQSWCVRGHVTHVDVNLNDIKLYKPTHRFAQA